MVGLARDLLVVIALLAGYVWLTILSRRIRALHRRIALHTCRDPEPARQRGDSPITVAELLDRERRLD